MHRHSFRISDPNHSLVNWMLKSVAVLVLVVALASCATAKLGTSETVVTDSTTRRQVQRLVAVSVPGDSAKLTSRLEYDEATGLFKPVTIFSYTAHGKLAFSVDAFGLVTASMLTTPWIAQVPVVDTEVTHSRSTKSREVVPVAAPLSGFVKFCVAFFIGCALLFSGWLYLKIFTPFK
jgi:hypothetical protein